MVFGNEQWGDVMLLDWRFDGFPGRVLWVDLTKGTVQAKEIPHDWLIESMGGCCGAPYSLWPLGRAGLLRMGGHRRWEKPGSCTCTYSQCFSTLYKLKHKTRPEFGDSGLATILLTTPTTKSRMSQRAASPTLSATLGDWVSR